MNFHPLRWLLLPFSLLFALVSEIRNWAYRKGILKGYSFDLPVISVGNLSLGGTGKTPMIAYLIELLREDFKIAVMSRGYRRKTRGLVLADLRSTVDHVGDEAVMLKQKYPHLTVAVRESRAEGIPELLMKKQSIEAILLDDAYQHRSLEPGLNILLTSHREIYTKDYILPVGNLRELPKNDDRADVIVVTKCPADLTADEMDAIRTEINADPHQLVLFSYLDYGYPYILGKPTETISLDDKMHCLLVCGIAAPEPMEEYILDQVNAVYRQYYTDHHNFSDEDLNHILTSFNNIESERKIIITTEKDVPRLLMHRDWLIQHQLPIFVLPVKHQFFEDQHIQFDQKVRDYVNLYFGKKLWGEEEE